MSKYKVFDSHAHYDDERFLEDRKKILIEAFDNNVVGILNCGSSIKGMRISYELSNEYELVYGALGIHPLDIEEFSNDILEEIEEKSKNDKIRAIGEIGLDYYYCKDEKVHEKQREIFIKQMELARKLNLPVIIHDREAHNDTMEIVKSFPDVKGVIHSYSGSLEYAEEYIKMGYYLGITGTVTFKNSQKVNNIVKKIPIEYLLIETDAPYMSPEPYRGKRNNSLYLDKIVEKIAEIKELDPQIVSDATIVNTKNLLKLK